VRELVLIDGEILSAGADGRICIFKTSASQPLCVHIDTNSNDNANSSQTLKFEGDITAISYHHTRHAVIIGTAGGAVTVMSLPSKLTLRDSLNSIIAFDTNDIGDIIDPSSIAVDSVTTESERTHSIPEVRITEFTIIDGKPDFSSSFSSVTTLTM